MNIRRWFWLCVFLGLGTFSLNSFPILFTGRSMNQTEVNTALLSLTVFISFACFLVCADYLYKINTSSGEASK